MRDKNDTDLLNERKFFSKQIEAIFAKTGSILSGDLRDSPHFRSYLKTGEFENPRANINEIFNEYVSIRVDTLKLHNAIRSLMFYKAALIEHNAMYGHVTESIMKKKSEANINSMKQLLLQNCVPQEYIDICENNGSDFPDRILESYRPTFLNKCFNILTGDNPPRCLPEQLETTFLGGLNTSVIVKLGTVDNNDKSILSSYFKNEELKKLSFHVETSEDVNVSVDLLDIFGDEERIPENTITKLITRYLQADDDKHKVGSSESHMRINNDGSKEFETIEYVSEPEFLERKRNEHLSKIIYTTSKKFVPEEPVDLSKFTKEQREAYEAEQKKIEERKAAIRKQNELEKNKIRECKNKKDVDDLIAKIDFKPYYYRDPANHNRARYVGKKFNYTIENIKKVDEFKNPPFNKKNNVKKQEFSCYEWRDGGLVLKEPKGFFANIGFFFAKLFFKSSEDKEIASINEFNASLNRISTSDMQKLSTARNYINANSDNNNLKKKLDLEFLDTKMSLRDYVKDVDYEEIQKQLDNPEYEFNKLD